MSDEELYDLQTDPYEIHNLAASAQPEHQAELKKLRALLEKWIDETNDQGRFPEVRADASAAGVDSEVPPRPKGKKKQKQQP
jgi:hypothetical protein